MIHLRCSFSTWLPLSTLSFSFRIALAQVDHARSTMLSVSVYCYFSLRHLAAIILQISRIGSLSFSIIEKNEKKIQKSTEVVVERLVVAKNFGGWVHFA